MSNQKTVAILTFTQDMILAAIEQRWDVVMDMKVRQDEMLQGLFSNNDLILSETEQNDLFEIKRLNQEVLKAAEAHKTDIAKELRSMRQGKLKANVYQAI